MLSWRPHINELNSKLSKTVGVIYKLRHYLEIPTLLMIYYALFFSHLLYGILSWETTKKSYLQCLQVTQNRIVKCISKEIGGRIRLSPLFNKLQILKFEHMYELELFKFMHQWENMLLPVVFNTYFTRTNTIHTHNLISSTTTRLYQRKCNKSISQLSIKYRGVERWNNMPNEHKEKRLRPFIMILKQSYISSQ